MAAAAVAFSGGVVLLVDDFPPRRDEKRSVVVGPSLLDGPSFNRYMREGRIDEEGDLLTVKMARLSAGAHSQRSGSDIKINLSAGCAKKKSREC